MIELLTDEPLSLPNMQEFHRRLDKAKDFESDFVRNVAYLVAEVGEVLNAYRQIDKVDDENEKENLRAHVAEELADCQAYIMKLSNYLDINLEEAYIEKMKRNVTRQWKTSP